MKKILSFLILGVSALQFFACSSNSNSGTNPNDEEKQLTEEKQPTSSCALANKYLPAYSAIAYEDAFGGGCKAIAQISATQATEYANLLVANDFEQTPLTRESFIYKKNVSVNSTITLVLAHQSGILTADLQKENREYKWGDLSVVAENFLYNDICADEWEYIDKKTLCCTANGDLDFIKLSDLGWRRRDALIQYQYNEKTYTIIINIYNELILKSN